jgi:hypothetical protein
MLCIKCYHFLGARPQTGNILAKLTELKEARDKLEDRQLHLQQVEAELSSVRKVAAK